MAEEKTFSLTERKDTYPIILAQFCVLRKRGRETKAFHKGCALVPTCKGHTLFCSLPAPRVPQEKLKKEENQDFTMQIVGWRGYHHNYRLYLN